MLLIDLAPGDVSTALRKYLPSMMPDCVVVALSCEDWPSVAPVGSVPGEHVTIDFGYGIKPVVLPADGLQSGEAVLLRQDEVAPIGVIYGIGGKVAWRRVTQMLDVHFIH